MRSKKSIARDAKESSPERDRSSATRVTSATVSQKWISQLRHTGTEPTSVDTSMNCCGNLPSLARLSCANVGPSAASIFGGDSAPPREGPNSELEPEAWARAKEYLRPELDYNTENECVICLGSLSVPPAAEYIKINNTPEFLIWVLPACGHSFHAQCIKNWFDRNTRCPVCKKEVSHVERGALREAVIIKRQAEDQEDARSLRQRQDASTTDVRARFSLTPVEQIPVENDQEQAQLSNQAAHSSSVYVFTEGGDARSPRFVAQQIFRLQATVSTADAARRLAAFQNDPSVVADVALNMLDHIVDELLDNTHEWTSSWNEDFGNPRFFVWSHGRCPGHGGNIQVRMSTSNDGTSVALDMFFYMRFWYFEAVTRENMTNYAVFWSGTNWTERLATGNLLRSRLQVNSVPDELSWIAANLNRATTFVLERFHNFSGDNPNDLEIVDLYNEGDPVQQHGYPALDSILAERVDTAGGDPGQTLQVVMRFTSDGS